MENDVIIHKLEEGVPYSKIDNIEKRLTGVEGALQELISTNDIMKDEIREKLSVVQTEMEKNTLHVKRLQKSYKYHQSNSKLIFCVMIVALVLWTIIMHWWKLSSI